MVVKALFPVILYSASFRLYRSTRHIVTSFLEHQGALYYRLELARSTNTMGTATRGDLLVPCIRTAICAHPKILLRCNGTSSWNSLPPHIWTYPVQIAQKTFSAFLRTHLLGLRIAVLCNTIMIMAILKSAIWVYSSSTYVHTTKIVLKTDLHELVLFKRC